MTRFRKHQCSRQTPKTILYSTAHDRVFFHKTPKYSITPKFVISEKKVELGDVLNLLKDCKISLQSSGVMVHHALWLRCQELINVKRWTCATPLFWKAALFMIPKTRTKWLKAESDSNLQHMMWFFPMSVMPSTCCRKLHQSSQCPHWLQSICKAKYL